MCILHIYVLRLECIISGPIDQFLSQRQRRRRQRRQCVKHSKSNYPIVDDTCVFALVGGLSDSGVGHGHGD